MEFSENLTATKYIEYLVKQYSQILRIHYFTGQNCEVPVLVCEIDSSLGDRVNLDMERWVCENFIDIYFLSPSKTWFSKCLHLNEGDVLVPDRVKNLAYYLAYEKDFGLFPLLFEQSPIPDENLCL